MPSCSGMHNAADDGDPLPLSSASSPAKTPSRPRSLSNARDGAHQLAPSPTFREGGATVESKDDHALPTTPRPPRRPELLTRGLSLQMPPRLEMPSPSQFPRPVPLSPQLDPLTTCAHQQSQHVLASPATSLPRHSRGLDFSRACTTLHHSTLAEQSSPDSSPVITQKGIMIPRRKASVSSMLLDSPYLNGHGSVPERSAVSSSVGSVNMMVSESESDDSEEDASMGGDENDDAIFTTPQVHKIQNPNTSATPFGAVPTTPSGSASAWGNGAFFSPSQAALMKTIRRTRLHKGNRRSSRKSSSSASGSGYSSMASPRATSPPPLRSIEGAANGGYFNVAASKSRRGSLALGTDGLHISSGNDSGDEASLTNTPSTPGVVRRVVSRRGNLLPKTKGFARIRAALAEESAPVDTEVRREAETIRQVRERDTNGSDLDLPADGRPPSSTEQSSPNLLPAVLESAQEDFGRDLDENPKGLGMNFAAHASRNSGGMDYWSRFDPAAARTPPPLVTSRQSSSIASDMLLDTDANTAMWNRPRAQSSTSDASDAFNPNGYSTNSTGTGNSLPRSAFNDDMQLKKFKRRREDDVDIATIKRRAVSPGMSAQNSPVLTQSPSQREAVWGQPPDRLKRENLPPSAGSDISQSVSMQMHLTSAGSQSSSQQTSRQGSVGSSMGPTSGSTSAGNSGSGFAGSGKKLGLQGMRDTNDGLMKMSIE